MNWECSQTGCKEPPIYRYTWPGSDEAGICAGHSVTLANVAAAMGMHLQLQAIPPSEPDAESDPDKS